MYDLAVNISYQITLMSSKKRQSQIYEMLRVKKNAKVIELMERFGVTDMTIRRDLAQLESIGLIERFHGGATIVGDLHHESAFSLRLVENYEKKAAIGKKALEFITEGMSLFIDGSTTCNELVKILPTDKRLTVFTNSVEALIQLRAKRDMIDIFLIGGELAKDNNTLDGYIAVETVQKIYVDACFISCGGFSVEGITNTGVIGTQIKKIVLSNGGKKYLLADSTKYNRRGLYLLGGWQSIDNLITDNHIGREAIAELSEIGVNVTVASNLFR